MLGSQAALSIRIVIGDNQMLRGTVVAAADVVGILGVKAADVEAIAVQVLDKRRAFDNQQETAGQAA